MSTFLIVNMVPLFWKPPYLFPPKTSKTEGFCQVAAIKAPGFGDNRKAILQAGKLALVRWVTWKKG